MKCKRVIPWLADLSAGRVKPRQEREIHEHLEVCGRCAREWRALTKTLSWLEHIPESSPPADLWQRVQTQIDSQQPRTISSGRFYYPWRWILRPITVTALAGSMALALVGAVFFTNLSRHSYKLDMASLARTNATFFCQHVNMDRGELFADNVALGAMASLVTDKMDSQVSRPGRTETTP